jgi:hypothetical protein
MPRTKSAIKALIDDRLITESASMAGVTPEIVDNTVPWWIAGSQRAYLVKDIPDNRLIATECWGVVPFGNSGGRVRSLRESRFHHIG